MLTKYTLSVWWNFLLLASFVSCAVLENWSSYQNTSSPWIPKDTPDNALDLASANENIPIAPTASDPAGPVNLEVATRTAASIITQPPTAIDMTCQPAKCTANASSVSLVYWASEAHNTDCLSTLTDVPEGTLPPWLPFTPISPSIYAIVVSFTATDGCKQIGNAFATFIASFAPDELSTITWDGTTHTNSFADVPCGPPGWVSDGKPYQPWFYPPHNLFDQMGGPGYAGCEFPAWKDPSYSLTRIDGPINGPDIPHGPHPDVNMPNPPRANLPQQKRAVTEPRIGVAAGVHSVDSDPINGPNPLQHRRPAATAQGAPQTPAKTADPN